MPGRRIAVGGVTADEEWFCHTREGQRRLAEALTQDVRPCCMCQSPGVPLYISRRGAHLFIARLPGSGFLHSTDCPSSEDLNLFSAADCYGPGVVQEAADGHQTVKMRSDQAPSAVSVSGLLDLMLEASGLNHHRVGEQRSWRIVRERLLAAAADITCEPGGRLAAQLVLPEAFDGDAPRAGADRFLAELAQAHGRRCVCAPFRSMTPSKFGWLLQLKHLAGVRFWVRSDEAQRIGREAGGTLSLDSPPPYALCFAVVEMGRDRGVRVVELCVRRTDKRFMPCLSDADEHLSDTLCRTSHYFRPLRFDADWTRPLADYVIVDEATWTIVMSEGATGQQSLDRLRGTLGTNRMGETRRHA